MFKLNGSWLTKNMKMTFAVVALTWLAAPSVSLAARAADIVEKTFLIKGPEAEQAADILDLSDGESLILEWNKQSAMRNCTGAMGTPDLPNCDELPARSVKIIYKGGGEPELKLSGSFEDETTASGAGFARFSFDSPPFNGSDAPGDWKNVLSDDLLKAPPSDDNAIWVTRSIEGYHKNVPALAVRLHEKKESGERMLSLAVDYDSAAEHKKKAKAHEECIKSSRGMLDGGC